MGWFSKKKKQAQVSRDAREVPDVLREHLSRFVTTRRGVEAWLEQPTNFNKPSILLVAASGESTRRAIPSIDYGYDFAAGHDIPAYDAGVVPYPARMRQYGVEARRRG
ncbi:MAG: hypothetical protein Q4P15_01895 [Propionibacteriaceae bacterium]|nr:hypothetical protein [Propionibacteriaceae bacterium]